jgi:hypothetical protein
MKARVKDENAQGLHPGLVEGGRYRSAKTVKTVDIRSCGT